MGSTDGMRRPPERGSGRWTTQIHLTVQTRLRIVERRGSRYAPGMASIIYPGYDGEREDQVTQTGLSLRPALTPSIADALTLKHGDLFFVTESDGDVPADQIHATGLYYHDCRFLDGYEFRLAGRRQEALVSTAGRGYQSLIELTNPELLDSEAGVGAHAHDRDQMDSNPRFR